MITLKELLDGSKDKDIAIRQQIYKIDEILKLLSPNNEAYRGWEKRKAELEAMLVKKESVNKESYARTPDEMAQYLYKKKYADCTPEEKKEVDIELGDLQKELGESCKKKEAYTVIKVDGAEVPIEINPDGNEGKDMRGNRYLKLNGRWVMESLKEYNTVMQGSPTDYKVGSRVRIVGGLYSNSFGKISALGDKLKITIEPTGEKVDVLPNQVVMAESFSEVFKALKGYDANKNIRKEGITKDQEKMIVDLYNSGETVDDIQKELRLKGIDMPRDGIVYIIQNFKEIVEEEPKAELKKEMANVNQIKLTGAWNIPKIVSKVQDLATSYGTHFSDGVIDTNGLLDKELNGLMGDLKGMGVSYKTESLRESLSSDTKLKDGSVITIMINKTGNGFEISMLKNGARTKYEVVSDIQKAQQVAKDWQDKLKPLQESLREAFKVGDRVQLTYGNQKGIIIGFLGHVYASPWKIKVTSGDELGKIIYEKDSDLIKRESLKEVFDSKGKQIGGGDIVITPTGKKGYVYQIRDDEVRVTAKPQTDLIGWFKGNELTLKESLKEFTPKGHNCDKCGAHLSEDDYVKAGSWHYNCPKCGYKYRESLKEAVIGQKIIVGNFDSDYPAVVTGVDNGKVTTAQVKMYGVTNEVIIDNNKWWIAKESLKEGSTRDQIAQKMFKKNYNDLTDAEKKKVDDDQVASLLLGENLKEMRLTYKTENFKEGYADINSLYQIISSAILDLHRESLIEIKQKLNDINMKVFSASGGNLETQYFTIKPQFNNSRDKVDDKTAYDKFFGSGTGGEFSLWIKFSNNSAEKLIKGQDAIIEYTIQGDRKQKNIKNIDEFNRVISSIESEVKRKL